MLKCFQIIRSFHHGKPPSFLLWHISPLSIRCFHSLFIQGERGSMSWHGKSHLSLNSQRPSITVWTERCDPNWSLSGDLTSSLPASFPPSRSPSLHLLPPFNTSQPSTSRVYIWNLSLWKVHRLTSGVLHKHRRAFKGHRKGIMTNSAHLVIVCSQ